MKNLLFLFCILSTVSLMAQKKATYDMVINKKVKGQIDWYVSKDGDDFKVGDTLIIGKVANGENYNNIIQFAGIANYPLTGAAQSSAVKIKSMKSGRGNLLVKTTKPQGYVYSLWISSFEAAWASGEIKQSGMTSDEALIELKKCKDKLDLELITQEEFDSIKVVLSKLIK